MKFSTDTVVDYYNKRLNKSKVDLERPNVRHQKAVDTIFKLTSPGRALDVGCGVGATTELMAAQGYKVTGIDIADKLVSWAKQCSTSENATYECVDLMRYQSSELFDLITMIDSLEHMDSVVMQVKQIRRLLKKSGLVYVNVPDGRLIKYLKKYRPEILQIIDNPYTMDEVIGLFDYMGFGVIYVDIYGIDCPQQYNEFLFTWHENIEKAYQRRFYV